MEVRIVTKLNNKVLVCFTNGEELENKNKKLQYTKGDVVFLEKDINGVFEIKEHHQCNKVSKYLDEINKNEINRSLLINKFTNIFNLGDNYFLNENEKKILKNLKKDNKFIEASLENTFDWIRFDGEISDKLIIGLGNQSVFETDIVLHNTYGIPYIPGSALKGVFKNYIIQEYFKECTDKCGEECNRQCEKNANNDRLFIQIFGGNNKKQKSVQGKVIFMDVFPSVYNMEKDVMTPHHSEYYGNGIELPLDTDKVKPIYFLVVNNKENICSSFNFSLAIDKTLSCTTIEELTGNNKILNKYKGKEIKKFILENIIDVLNFHGIGAKTSIGYGYFNIDEEKVKNKVREQENIKELKKQKRLKEEEFLKKQIEEEEKFKKNTKNMSDIEIELYKVDKITDEIKKNEVIVNFYSENIDKLCENKQKYLAKYMKNYLQVTKKWKYKYTKKNKVDKNSQRVKKICEILNIDLP